MPRTALDDQYEEEDDDELPEGVYHDDEWPTVPCPYCRREIAEDSDRCPHCENDQSREDAPLQRRGWFWAVMMVLALAVALWWVIG